LGTEGTGGGPDRHVQVCWNLGGAVGVKDVTVLDANMLEVRQLTKRYRGITAVESVSFSIRPGEILGYIGANGAGKSTTIKMVIGLIEPSSGQVLFQGRNVAEDMRSFQSRLGYVAEEAHLYPHLSGYEYLQLAGRLHGIPRAVLEEKILELLRLLGLFEERLSPLASYSKGMRQKILLSAALLHDPEVLILDEPFSGLDVNAAMILRELLRAFAERGKIVLYSSHVLEVVEKVATSVLVLSKGKVIAHDSVANLQSLMSQQSLEGVFAQLTLSGDPQSTARRILEAVAR